jgi:uridine kinase
VKHAPPELLVAIVGGTNSGKTTLEAGLVRGLGDQVSTFSFDDMFVGMQAIEGRTIDDWEDPGLYRWDDFGRHLNDLKNGLPVTIKANSRESTAAGLETRVIEPRPIVVVLGFLVLHDPEIRPLFDVSLYIELPEDEIIRRRLARAKPGSPWDSQQYINQKLIPGHRRVVVSQRRFVDHELDGMLPPEQLVDEALRIISARE